MKLKLDKDGNVVTKEVDGELVPVYDRNGKEETHDAAAAIETIKAQANEIEDLEKSSDKQVKDLNKKVKAWERLGEIADVRKAIKTVESLKDGDIDPESAKQQLANLQAERDTLKEQLDDATEKGKERDQDIWKLAIGNAIRGSKWIRENLIDAFANNPEHVEQLYGSHFKFEDGEVKAYGSDGKPILTVDGDNKVRPASVDEALDQLMNGDFRKPSGVKGSDAPTVSPGSVHAGAPKHKGDLRSPTDKAKYIDEHGLEAFQSLPPAPLARDDVATV